MKVQRSYIRPSVRNRLIDALDGLALALANKHHHWTNKERKDYETAIHLLTWND
jgi:hypothetical protein